MRTTFSRGGSRCHATGSPELQRLAHLGFITLLVVYALKAFSTVTDHHLGDHVRDTQGREPRAHRAADVVNDPGGGELPKSSVIILSSRAFALLKPETGFSPKVVENRWSPFVNRGRASMTATACSESGTRCVAFDLNRSGGTVQIFVFRSNSRQQGVRQFSLTSSS